MIKTTNSIDGVDRKSKYKITKLNTKRIDITFTTPFAKRVTKIRILYE